MITVGVEGKDVEFILKKYLYYYFCMEGGGGKIIYLNKNSESIAHSNTLSPTGRKNQRT